jgi:Rap1a immunity proteins
MKHLRHTLGAFALCCAVSLAAHAEGQDGNFLLRECKETLTATYQECSAAVSGMHCLGFIDGLVDMNNIYKATVLKSPSRGLICLPKDKHLTTGQLARVVVEYLERNPGQLQQPAPTLATVALGKAFPCKSEPPSP